MDQSLVSCTTCSICDFLKLVESLFYFLVALSFVIAIFFAILSGFLRIVSIGDRVLITVAKRGLRFTLIGFAVCLTAWLSVNAIYSVVGVKGDNWWSLNCETALNGDNQTGAKPSRYSDFKNLKPLQSLNEIISDSQRVGVLDLEKVDQMNLAQDLSLLSPGENIKFLAGYSDLTQADLETIVNLLNGAESSDSAALDSLTKKVQELAGVEMLDGGLYLTGSNDFSEINVSDYDSNTYDFSNLFGKLIKLMLSKTINKVIVYKAGNSEINLDKCIDSGGDWVEFYNGCAGRKQICGKETLKCSTLVNKTAGCQCAEGSCLVNGKCTVRSTANNAKKDDDSDGIKNNLDKCAGTPKGEPINKDSASENYGCSCSQLNLATRTCPATRCEGTNLVTYPPSGNDICTSGKITQYSCNSTGSIYNATCNQVQNMTNLADKENEIKKNDDLYNLLKNWLSKGGSSGTGSGSSSGSGSGSGSGNKGGSGSGTGTGTGNTSSNDTSSTSTTPSDTSSTSTDTSGSNGYTPSSDLGKDGNFDQLAQCMGFKKGEIPKNGALIGFYKDNSHTTMDVWYLDPRTGKAVGNNGDSGMPLRTYPQGTGGGVGKDGIYAVQVQPHYSDDGDTVESSLTMRSDLRMGYDGSSPNRTTRINIHPGQSTRGCLGTGNRNQQDNFMQHTWTTVRGSAKPPDYNDDCSQAKGACYNKHRKNDTILFSTMPYGTCKGDPYKAIQTLQSRNDYGGYDPQMIDFSKNVKS